MDPLVTAQWIGPYEVELPDRTRLAPGQDVSEIPVLEAVISENWQPVEVAEDPDAAELREVARTHGVSVAHNAGVELVLERLEEAGVEPTVYRPIEIDVAELFGEEVADIVDAVTEPQETELGPAPTQRDAEGEGEGEGDEDEATDQEDEA